jgi:hypothetical protein
MEEEASHGPSMDGGLFFLSFFLPFHPSLSFVLFVSRFATVGPGFFFSFFLLLGSFFSFFWYLSAGRSWMMGRGSSRDSKVAGQQTTVHVDSGRRDTEKRALSSPISFIL